MKKICYIILLFLVQYGFSSDSTFTVLKKTPFEIPILMYHHIRTSNPHDPKVFKDLSCPEPLFIEQLNALKSAGYETITFYNIDAALEGKYPLPEHPIILSFDDSPSNNWLAYEDLKERGMRGVFFVITRFIGDRKHLSMKQLQIMSNNGMEIGSHTAHHVDLTEVPLSRAKQQITESKEEIELIIHKPVITFCYPSGKHNKAIMKLVAEAGYHYARSTKPGIAYVSKYSYELPTIRIHDKTSPQSLLNTLTALSNKALHY